MTLTSKKKQCTVNWNSGKKIQTKLRFSNKTWGKIRIQISIKIERRIRIRIAIETMPIHNIAKFSTKKNIDQVEYR